jgi:dienelactone hydrolase
MSWSADEGMAPGAGQENLEPANLQVTAEINGQAVAAANCQRLLLAPGVKRIPVHDGKLRGILFVPPGKGPHPGIIVLGGSEGGVNELNVAFLASKGYAALALAYFAYEDLPPSLDNIPLEYFETAINWLGSRPEVRNHELAVIGGSRGGELALLLGSTFPQIKAVVAVAPSGVIWGGITATDADPPQAAWTYHGQPLPFMGFQDLTPDQQKQAGEILHRSPFSSLPLFQLMLAHRAAVEKATIPVEKINGPVLLVSGNDDRMWPSTQFADLVVERLKQAKHPYHDRHLAYPNAGHYLPLPNLPATVNQLVDANSKTVIALGGDPEPTAVAAADAWAQIVAFLHTTFAAAPPGTTRSQPWLTSAPNETISRF